MKPIIGFTRVMLNVYLYVLTHIQTIQKTSYTINRQCLYLKDMYCNQLHINTAYQINFVLQTKRDCSTLSMNCSYWHCLHRHWGNCIVRPFPLSISLNLRFPKNIKRLLSWFKKTESLWKTKQIQLFHNFILTTLSKKRDSTYINISWSSYI